MKKSILIMAAGSGSRYGGLKQFDTLGNSGEYLMEFAIYDAILCGFDHVVLITKPAYVNELQTYISARLPNGVQLDVLGQDVQDLPAGCTPTIERQKPWGTAHAVWTARHCIGNPFVVVNADDFYGREAYKAAAKNLNAKHYDFAMIAYRLDQTLSPFGSVSRGICEMVDHRLEAIAEITQLEAVHGKIIDRTSGVEYPADSLVSMNFWICHPDIFDYIETALKQFITNNNNLEKGEVYIPLVLQEYCGANQIPIGVLQCNASWFGITYAPDKEAAKSKLASMQEASVVYPDPLWKQL